jgi:hypothetical protein
MRTITLLILIFFVSSFQSRSKKDFTAGYYYFCDSHPFVWGASDKKYILYTDIVQIECEEAYFKTLAEEWGKTVTNNCKNEQGCTSDLNYYHTLSDAKTQLDKLLKRYSDTTIYNVRKVTLNVGVPQEK